MTYDQITEDTPNHHYKTELPNLIFELGLNVYDIAVYASLKYLSNDEGKCLYSRKFLIEKTGVSPSKLDETLKKLSKIKVGKNYLININERYDEFGGRIPNEIFIPTLNLGGVR